MMLLCGSSSDKAGATGPRVAGDDGKRLATCSLILNLCLTGTKYLFYLLSGSAALLAETVHSLTDVVGSFLVLGGIRLAAVKSAHFPWGLYKAENVAALLSSGMIFASAFEIAHYALRPAVTPLKHLDITAVGLLLMALPVYFFSRYEQSRALTLNSPALLADAAHWRTDLAPLVLVAAGIAAAYLGSPVFDKGAALLVLLLVVKAGYALARDALKSLLDASVDRGTLNAMRRVVNSVPEVAEVVSIGARNSGRFVFADLVVRLSVKSLKQAHEVADRIEREVLDSIPSVEKVTVHYEPERKISVRHAVPLSTPEGELAAQFGAAPFLAIWDEGAADGIIHHREVVRNPGSEIGKGKGIKVAEYLVEKGVDVVYTPEDIHGKGPDHVFSAADVEVRKVSPCIVRNVFELWKGDLEAVDLQRIKI